MFLQQEIIDLRTYPKPFLKWAGGKNSLLDQIIPYLPEPMPKNYAELFLGGGAMFWYLQTRYHFKRIWLNDINDALTNVYECIKYNPELVIKHLSILQSCYAKEETSLTDEELEKYREQLFFLWRDKFNQYNVAKLPIYQLERAVLLIALNKTCYNGLYRVNSKKEFNTSFGKYINPTICDKDNLKLCSQALQKAWIQSLPFSAFVSHEDSFVSPKDRIPSDTFIYLDPPYKPIADDSFTSYADRFNDEDQKQLARCCQTWSDRGIKIMLSNSYHPDFFGELYPGWRQIKIERPNRINCNGGDRGVVKELLILNY